MSNQPMRNAEYKSKLYEYDEIIKKISSVAVLQEDINNFFARKTESVFGIESDKHWTENQDKIEEQVIERTKAIHKLCEEELR